ncbi:MAG: hypothetical protein WBA05_10515 [Gordonia sp. (in: high G+C Gram-positive bacteria)]|uniref:hypothetical protein n=1 Tax=Gordonia sp. (in: high G+C Gram-positive bacteria) TaxID=84139 RepID=UPI003C70E071
MNADQIRDRILDHAARLDLYLDDEHVSELVDELSGIPNVDAATVRSLVERRTPGGDQ